MFDVRQDLNRLDDIISSMISSKINKDNDSKDMNVECYIVIATICLFQLLDIFQLREITKILKNNNNKEQ